MENFIEVGMKQNGYFEIKGLTVEAEASEVTVEMLIFQCE